MLEIFKQIELFLFSPDDLGKLGWLCWFFLWVILLTVGFAILIKLLHIWKKLYYQANRMLKDTEPAPAGPTLFSQFIFIALVITFAGFAYMHYNTVVHDQSQLHISQNSKTSNSVVPQTYPKQDFRGATSKSPPPSHGQVDSDARIQLFESMQNSTDRATSRVFAFVTVLIAFATLIVALQFIVNARMMKDLESKADKIKKDFEGKESKLSQMDDAIGKVEFLAQATSYPLQISMHKMKTYKKAFLKRMPYIKGIKNSFTGFNSDNLKDKADWNSILFMAKQALASKKTSLNNPTVTDIKRLVAVAACKSEECTGDREEKSILLTLAINTFESMPPLGPEDKVNLASAYARRGMLYACLPKSSDYEKADSEFEKAIKYIKDNDESIPDLKDKAYYNWGLSWLLRASLFERKPEEWGLYSVKKSKKYAEKYLKIAKKTEYALLTLYSISKEKEKFENIIKELEARLDNNEESLPLPKPHRIKEDIDLDFIRTKHKNLYERLTNLTEKNDELKSQKENSSPKSDTEA